MDCVVTNGQVVTADGLKQVDVGIRAGRIAGLGSGLEGARRIDANGCYVFPGFIDPHVHLQMRIGENLTGDDFRSGTIAAACGGTTTIIDFTENCRGDDLEEWVSRRRGQVDGSATVDYALHLQLADYSPSTLAHLRRLSEDGYRSAKLYTTYDGVRLSDRDFLELLDAVRAHGREAGWSRLEVTTPPLPAFERTLAFYEREGFAVAGGRKLRTPL